jgi:hypothetical protein
MAALQWPLAIRQWSVFPIPDPVAFPQYSFAIRLRIIVSLQWGVSGCIFVIASLL